MCQRVQSIAQRAARKNAQAAREQNRDRPQTEIRACRLVGGHDHEQLKTAKRVQAKADTKYQQRGIHHPPDLRERGQREPEHPDTHDAQTHLRNRRLLFRAAFAPNNDRENQDDSSGALPRAGIARRLRERGVQHFGAERFENRVLHPGGKRRDAQKEHERARARVGKNFGERAAKFLKLRARFLLRMFCRFVNDCALFDADDGKEPKESADDGGQGNQFPKTCQCIFLQEDAKRNRRQRKTQNQRGFDNRQCQTLPRFGHGVADQRQKGTARKQRAGAVQEKRNQSENPAHRIVRGGIKQRHAQTQQGK